MKFSAFALIAASFFAISTVFSSCHEQTSNAIGNNSLVHSNSVSPSTDTVSTMGEGVMIIFQDGQGNFWFGSNGVYKYDGKNFVHFTTKNGLCSNQIWSIQEDKSGNIYFDGGECVSKFDGQAFTTLSLIDNNASENQWKLEADDLWFKGKSDENGPYRYDGESLYHLEFPRHPLEDEFYSKYPKAPYSPYGIYSIYEDKKGAVWFGTSTFGACRYDGESIAWISEDELTELDDGPAPGVRAIIEDKDGYYLFSNSLYRYKISQKETQGEAKNTLVYERLEGLNGMSSDGKAASTSYMSITDGEHGDLWMATYDEGVWRYTGEALVHYPVKDGNTEVTLFSIYKDRRGVLWLGTHHAGAFRFNGKTFEPFRP